MCFSEIPRVERGIEKRLFLTGGNGENGDRLTAKDAKHAKGERSEG